MRAARYLFMGLFTFLTGCTYTAPYRRMGVPPSTTAIALRPVLVAVSEVEHRRGQFAPFFADTKGVLATMPEQDGLLGYSFRIEIFGRKAWTLTVWRDDAALDAFVRSPAHRAAVRRSGETAQATKFFTYEAPSCEPPPTWGEALRRLEAAPGYPRNEPSRRPAEANSHITANSHRLP